MILSSKYRFVFVHIPKTAGISVTESLKPFSDDRKRSLAKSIKRRLPFIENPNHVHFREHEPALKMVQKLSRRRFDELTSFSVVRDPFDHAVSHYEYMKQFRIASVAEKVGAMTFNEYLRYRTKKPFWNDTVFARLPDQCYFLMDSNNQICVDRLIRFENLQQEMQALAADLDLKGYQLPHKNKTKSQRKPLRSYYDQESIDLVRKIYRRDFEHLGYSIDFLTQAT